MPIFQVTRFQCAIGNSESDQRRLVFKLQVSQSDPATTKSLLLRTAVMLPQIDGPSEYPSMVDNRTCHRMGGRSTRQDRGTVYPLRRSARTADHCNVGKVTIEILPEEILLEIFGFYVFGFYSKWQTLVHVCRRWRSIVFAAPRCLNLRLFCTGWTPAREMLDIWPALPIVVRVRGKEDEINDNVLAALEKHDRICKVHIDNAPVGDIEELALAGAMQVTFPTLTDLDIHAVDYSLPASFPESLLGGSAPKLRSLRLMYIAFPALPKLLLASPGLVSLSLIGTSYSGYISPDAIVDCLSSLTRLEYLQLDFLSPQPRPDSASRRTPALTRIVLPVLSTLLLEGETEHVDQLLAHIEAPHLNDAHIEFVDPGSVRSMHITFPALPKLLLSSSGLVRLFLFVLPGRGYITGYISTDAMVDCLSSLTRLEHLQIEFPYSLPRPDNASPRPPPLTRTVFPVLSALLLSGVTEYLDQLLAHIEAPHLNNVRIVFLDQSIFEISRLSPCIGHTETFEAFDQAWMQCLDPDLMVTLSSRKGTTGSKTLTLSVRWKDSSWKLARLAYGAPSLRPILFQDGYLSLWTKDIGITPWLDFLRVFTTVENLYVSTRLALCIAPALQEPVGEGVTEVLPALQSIFVYRPETSKAEIIQEVMGKVVAARELSGRPVTVNIEP